MVGAVFRDRFPMQSLVELRHVSRVGRPLDPSDEPGHPDGWGLVSFREGSPRYVGRSSMPAYVDASFDSAVSSLKEIVPPNIVIAHARKGSEGGISMENTHPFISEGLAFAHNGTVREFSPKTNHKPKGRTDSERIFMLLADKFVEHGDLGSALRTLITAELRTYEYSAKIFLVSDGKRLYGYREYSDPKSDWYYMLKVARFEDSVVLFQEVEDESSVGGDVREVKNGELVTVDLGLNVEVNRLV
jgi:glutamine amidotransferase